MSAPVIRRALTDQDVLSSWSVVVQLRPHIERTTFLATVRRMESQGYRLVLLETDGAVTAVVGYRVVEMLRTGAALVVDDFATDATARSLGYGRLLHDWLVQEAMQRGCSGVELDSAVHRTEAHRFYFRQRMSVLAFHFSLSTAEMTPAAQVGPA